MLAYKLVKQNCVDSISYNVGSKLGDGAHGEVFEIADRPEHVIKFGVYYEIEESIEERFESIDATLRHMQANPSPIYANVFSYGSLGIYQRTVWGNEQQRYLLYYYVLEKLQKISEDEYRVFDSLISHEDREKEKDLSPVQIKKILVGLSRALDFDAKKITFFVENLRNSAVKHLDVHPRNIMKDSAGNFKLVDFDRMKLCQEKIL